MHPYKALAVRSASSALLGLLLIAPSAGAQVRYPVPYPYGRYSAADSSIRIAVKPKDAMVYVDGYYAGTVDEFDGAFQRLHVQPGQHDIVVYLEGYRPMEQKLYLSPDASRKITGALERLAPGEPTPPLPAPVAQPQAPPQGAPQGPPQRGRGFPPRNGPRNAPPPPPQPQGPPPDQAASSSQFGTLAIRVQPSGADVMIDGQRWAGPQGDDERLIVQVAEGRHVVEVRKDGYRLYMTEISVRPGETAPVNVSLTAERR